MAKRRRTKDKKASEDEIESRRPAKQLKKQSNSSTEISGENMSSSPKKEPGSIRDSDIGNLGETSGTAADDTHYESFSSFLKAFSYDYDESDNEHPKSNDASQNASNECEKSMIDNKRRNSHEEVSCLTSSSHENVLNEELDSNIRIIHVPSKASQLVLLQHPSSLTLHGFVRVSVKLGNIRIFGYNLKTNETFDVFSTEGTGLKKVVTAETKNRLEIEDLKKDLEKLTRLEEDINLVGFMDDIGRSSTVLVLEKILLPAPLRFLELYYPTALQTRWVRSEASKKKKEYELCSTEQSYTIDIGDDFEVLSGHVNEVISKSDGADFGPRILVRGDKNMGKSTLIRYLMNSSLNNVDEVYFLDTDPGQTEYTPSGVVSLLRVTKPLLGPPFAHQKKPLKMIFTGSVTPATSTNLHEASVVRLMKYFTANFSKKTLFVNTVGWVQGVGELCLQNVKKAVKPTIEIELVAPDPELPFSSEVDENEVTVFKVPSKAPSIKRGAPSYSPVELRNFNIMAYLGQCLKPFMPLTLINSLPVYCIGWDQIALYVMEPKVPAHCLVQAIHCSIVGLCRVDLSLVLKSDNPDFPMTLSDEPLCECLGFGLVRQSDETKRLYYIVTPLTLDQLKNVNALVKGNIMIPDEIFLKQTIKNKPLPFTMDISHLSLLDNIPGLKAVPKRAFRNTLTPNKTKI